MTEEYTQGEFFDVLDNTWIDFVPPVINSLPEEISEPEAEPLAVSENTEKRSADFLSLKRIQRAALAWVAEKSPTAAGLHVPTRLARFSADIAAFWSEPTRHRLLHPVRTMIVETCLLRETCWPGCSGKEDVISHLRETRQIKARLEEKIRLNEPYLRDSDMLFPEYESWNYANSSDPEYQKNLHSVADLERMLYHGTRFELILEAEIATEQYLAVPENVIHPDELAEGWGLLYVKPDLSIETVLEAPVRKCPEVNMLHLSQNIAAASFRDVLFSNGIFLRPDGTSLILRPPKRRRLPVQP